MLIARKEEAIACEQAAVDILRRHDTTAALAAVRPDAVLVEADGSRQGRAAWLALVGDSRRTLGATHCGTREVITVSPAAMVVVYTMESLGDYAGVPFHLAEALSALWVWRGGVWECAFMQVTPCRPE